MLSYKCKNSFLLLSALVVITLNVLLVGHHCYATDATQLQANSNKVTKTLQEDNVANNVTTTSGTEQICSNKMMLKNSNLCKPCFCEPTGSDSQHCDQLTRRCPCKPGYTGSKCDKCSYGFYNTTTAEAKTTGTTLDLSSDPLGAPPIAKRWQCESCGPCFDVWQNHLLNLKNGAVSSIKRVSELERLLIDRLNIDDVSKRLVVSRNRTGLLDTLENSIKRVGEKILANKQASDQINLLSSELNDTAILIHETEATATGQLSNFKRFEARHSNLTYYLELQTDLSQQLSKSLSSFRADILTIQEFIPGGAIRLIKANRNRTRKALEEILSHDGNFWPQLDSSLSDLELKLERVKYSKRQMDYIGSRILNETVASGYLTTDSDASALVKLFSPGEVQDYLRLDVQRAASSISELDIQMFDSYQANFENRMLDVSAIRQQIEDAKAILLRSGNLIAAFDNNLTTIFQTVASLNGTSSCDYDQLVENSTQIVRASLDKIDVRLPNSQAELAELTLKINAFNATTGRVFSNLSLDISRALGDHLSNLAAFKLANPESNFTEVASLNNRTRLLADDLEKLARNLSHLADLKQTTTKLSNDTRRLNSLVVLEQEKLGRWMGDLASNDSFREYLLRPYSSSKSSSELSNIDSLRSSTRTLTADSRINLERMRNHSSISFAQRYNSDKLLADKIELLYNTTAQNKRLSQEVDEKLSELSQSMQIIDGSGLTSGAEFNSTRLMKLRDRRRLANVVSDIRQISLLLHKDLMETQNLSRNFDEYERVFARQRDTIDALHQEMDVINSDLKKKSDYYENCPIQ